MYVLNGWSYLVMAVSQTQCTHNSNAANTRQARSVKREAIFHRNTCLAYEKSVSLARWSGFSQFWWLASFIISYQGQTNCDVTLLCTENFLASRFTLIVCLRLKAVASHVNALLIVFSLVYLPFNHGFPRDFPYLHSAQRFMCFLSAVLWAMPRGSVRWDTREVAVFWELVKIVNVYVLGVAETSTGVPQHSQKR